MIALPRAARARQLALRADGQDRVLRAREVRPPVPRPEVRVEGAAVQARVDHVAVQQPAVRPGRAWARGGTVMSAESGSDGSRITVYIPSSQ